MYQILELEPVKQCTDISHLYLDTTLVSRGIQIVGAQMCAALMTIFLQALFLLFRNISVICKYLFIVYRNVHSWIFCAKRLNETCMRNNNGYVPLVVNTSRFIPNSSLMTGFVTRFLVSVIKCLVFQLDVQLKAAFAVVPTNNICGRSLSLKILFDMNSIILKLYVTWLTWPRNLDFRGDFCRF